MTTPTADSNDRDGYYIYGLVDPQFLHETGGDPLLSIFYVGKGKNSRWMRHEKDVLDALAREEILLERRGEQGGTNPDDSRQGPEGACSATLSRLRR